MCRTLAEKRHNDWKKAIRKHKICVARDGSDWYTNLHQYSKNKIHCSCPMCKPRLSKRRPNFGENRAKGGWFFKISNARRYLAMTAREEEYENGFIGYAG